MDTIDFINQQMEVESTLRQLKITQESILENISSKVTDCMNCGDEIGKRRKELIPSTPLCVECAEENQRPRKS